MSARLLLRPLVDENPVTVQILGLCSALAVSRTLEPALIMAASVVVVLVFSSAAVSAMRAFMPKSLRLVLEVTIVASAVIVVDQVLMAYAPATSEVLSVFVGLIITNCLVLARVESFALHNPVGASVIDAFGNALGYAVVLVAIAALRELLGAGSLLGIEVLPEAFPRSELMAYAPSAFFLLALVVWGVRSWRPDQVELAGPD